MTQTKFSAANLLNKLSQTHPTPDRLKDAMTQAISEPDLPLIMRIFMGVGAFIAAVCFIVFLGMTDIIDFTNEATYALWGLIFMGAALGLGYVCRDPHKTSYWFFIQCAFAFMAVAKGLLVFWGAEQMEDFLDIWSISQALFVVTLMTYFIFPHAIDRFLSSFFTLLAVTFTIMDQMEHSSQYLLDGFFLLQLVGMCGIFMLPRLPRLLEPLGYALCFNLVAHCTMVTAAEYLFFFRHSDLYSLCAISAFIAMALSCIIMEWAGGLEKISKPPLLFAIIGIVGIACLSMPGLLMCLLLMVLGYGRHDRVMLGLGLICAPGFIYLFYYNMDITLLNKSLIMIASGGAMLIGAAYLHITQNDKRAS